jgi:hypothetical protein
MTNKEALEIAKKELDMVSYHLECSNLNAGLQKIFENKYDFLRTVVRAMEHCVVETKN